MASIDPHYWAHLELPPNIWHSCNWNALTYQTGVASCWGMGKVGGEPHRFVLATSCNMTTTPASTKTTKLSLIRWRWLKRQFGDFKSTKSTLTQRCSKVQEGKTKYFLMIRFCKKIGQKFHCICIDWRSTNLTHPRKPTQGFKGFKTIILYVQLSASSEVWCQLDQLSIIDPISWKTFILVSNIHGSCMIYRIQVWQIDFLSPLRSWISSLNW